MGQPHYGLDTTLPARTPGNRVPQRLDHYNGLTSYRAGQCADRVVCQAETMTDPHVPAELIRQLLN